MFYYVEEDGSLVAITDFGHSKIKGIEQSLKWFFSGKNVFIGRIKQSKNRYVDDGMYGCRSVQILFLEDSEDDNEDFVYDTPKDLPGPNYQKMIRELTLVILPHNNSFDYLKNLVKEKKLRR